MNYQQEIALSLYQTANFWQGLKEEKNSETKN